ncbi:MAG TPA: nucleotide exchange factor GrpE [Candidatus Nanoarchaeia archaeon]|nr:nucleotide exchange factor GrpE [Candidatus Nanoarchaeia archaeon]
MTLNKKTQKEKPAMEPLKEKAEDGKEKELEEYTNTLKRLQADFENYIKRMEKEGRERQEYASAGILQRLLGIVDDFERALRIADQKDALTQGMQMMYQELLKLLAEEGVIPIKAVGEKFDPYRHEILDFQEAQEEGMVIEELQKGYAYKDKVLRTSKVKVGKKVERENVQRP